MEPDEENGAWRNNDLAGQIKLQKQYTGRNEPGRPISSNTTDIKGVDNSKSFWNDFFLVFFFGNEENKI